MKPFSDQKLGYSGAEPCESCGFTRSNCLIYIKSGNMAWKSGKYLENYQKIVENRNFHIVSIETASTPAYSLSFILV